MGNDNSKQTKRWKTALCVLIFVLIGLYLYYQLETDPVYTPVYYPIQGAVDRNNELFEMQQEQYRKDVAARDRAYDNWHQSFIED
jgi:hypothetical protein